MKRRLRPSRPAVRVGLAVVLLATFVRSEMWAQTAPSTAPADADWTTMSSQVVGLKLSYPKAWQAVEVAPKEGDGGSDQGGGLSALRFRGADKAGTILAILRNQTPVKGDAAAVARSTAAHHRLAAKQHHQTVVDDRAIDVAGSQGWLIEAETTLQGQSIRVLTVCFVADDREFKLTMAGQTDAEEKLKPDVLRVLASIEPLGK